MPSVGAFIVLLALALDPFVQLLATYPLREVYKPSNKVVSSRTPIPPNVESKPPLHIIGLRIVRVANLASKGYNSPDQVSLTTDAYTEAILTNLYGVAPVPWPQPICPSGNCTWPEFESLGFCSQCIDVAKLVQMTCTDDVGWNCTISFPTGQSANVNNDQGNGDVPTYLMASWILNYIPGSLLPTLSGTIPGFGEVSTYAQGTFAGFTNPVLAMGRVVMDPSAYSAGTSIEGAFINGTATECALTLCAKSLKLSEQSGKTSLQVVHTLPGGYTTYSGADSGYPNASFIHLPYSKDFESSSNVTFPTALSGLVDYASFYLTGNVTVLQGESLSGYGSDANTIDAVNAIQNFTDFMDRLAASLTVAFLEQTGANIVSPMTGSLGAIEQYIHVRWAWLSLPAAVIALGISFLIMTIAETDRLKIKIWKTSSLALLYHGLDGPPENPALLNKTSEMEDNAMEFKVRLGRTSENGWQLLRVGRSHKTNIKQP